MNGADVRSARAKLGEAWGLGRPLHLSELGRALRLRGRDPGATVKEWEDRPEVEVTGPVQVAIEAMLAGYRPNAK